jgi:hypothetical protein
MAHVGRRYGDAFDARSLEGPMSEVAQGDRRRIARIEKGDAEGFWDEVRGTERDALRWCGASAFYAFLRAAGPVRGETRLYEQWNIDEGSVVSFGALRFTRP